MRSGRARRSIILGPRSPNTCTLTAGRSGSGFASATPSNSPVSQGLSTLIRNLYRVNGEGVTGPLASPSPSSWLDVGRSNPEQPEPRTRRRPTRRFTPDLPRLLEVGETDLREIHLRLRAGLALDRRRALGRAAVPEELHQLHLELHHIAREYRPLHLGPDR